jgi:hypothetical protein
MKLSWRSGEDSGENHYLRLFKIVLNANEMSLNIFYVNIQ